ncbi:hypothetical protein [Ammoniphilus sp. YIM 78166]|uniref:hypothetical protein n=1 Tax=Ammoniphilus sp. YIM 78166 TaxID=1644106 RepID=UPI00107011DE|nr:hypothetical protein [Ammoniphilus sp. YIM 78166]
MYRKGMQLFFFLLLFMMSPLVQAEGKEADQAIFIVKASPSSLFESRLHVQNQKLVKEILKGKTVPMTRVPELPYAYLELVQKGKKEVFMVSYSFNLFQLEKREKILLPLDVKSKMRTYIETLRQHHFGQMVTWREAERMLPRKGYAEVVDVETGLRFHVQRRAGSQHADVQPLTAEDTKIMKKIYNGKWSWKRRAILVRTDGKILAGSMHGMPHGGGAITWNEFPGHFCIHFKDSTTHRRDTPDPGHDLMISKASGELHDRIVYGSPEELASLFITAVNEHDTSIIRLLLNQAESAEVEKLLRNLEDIESVRIHSIEKAKTKELDLHVEVVPMIVNLARKGQREQRVPLVFLFTRGSLWERWKLELEGISL